MNLEDGKEKGNGPPRRVSEREKAIVKVIQSGSMVLIIMAVMDFWSGGGTHGPSST